MKAKVGVGSSAVILAISLIGSACARGSTDAATGPSAGGATPVSTPSLAPEGSALDVPLAAPESLAFDNAGNLYVSEFDGARIDRIAPDGSVEVVVGTGTPGFAGDGGPAVSAMIDAPCGIVVTQGSITFADHGNDRIRTVASDGTIGTLAGGSSGGLGDGGAADHARLDDPIGIVMDRGVLLIADEQDGRIRAIDRDGTITTVAGGGSRSIGASIGAVDLALAHPSYVVVLPGGAVAFTDFGLNVVLRIDRSGTATVLAGTGTAGYSGDGGPADAAELSFPTGLAVGPGHVLYVSDAGNHVVRAIDLDSGSIRTVAGDGSSGFAGDGGPAIDAQLSAPAGLTVDADGRLFIADQGNDVVRMVDAGAISTVAGVAPGAGA